MQEPPLLNPCGLVDYTTGGESHPALKCIYSYFMTYLSSCQEILRDILFSEHIVGRKCKNLASFPESRYNQGMEIIALTQEETIAAAERFAACLKGGDVVLLSGELGAGKTTFTKGIALALGVKDRITSPTFTIIKEYRGRDLMFYHMDLYRVSDGDLAELGLDEYLGCEQGISVIEWCNTTDFHARVFDISISYFGEGRKIEISSPRII